MEILHFLSRFCHCRLIKRERERERERAGKALELSPLSLSLPIAENHEHIASRCAGSSSVALRSPLLTREFHFYRANRWKKSTPPQTRTSLDTVQRALRSTPR